MLEGAYKGQSTLRGVIESDGENVGGDEENEDDEDVVQDKLKYEQLAGEYD